MNLNSKEVRFSALMSPVKRVLSGLSQVNFNLVGFFFWHSMWCVARALLEWLQNKMVKDYRDQRTDEKRDLHRYVPSINQPYTRKEKSQFYLNSQKSQLTVPQGALKSKHCTGEKNEMVTCLQLKQIYPKYVLTAKLVPTSQVWGALLCFISLGFGQNKTNVKQIVIVFGRLINNENNWSVQP